MNRHLPTIATCALLLLSSLAQADQRKSLVLGEYGIGFLNPGLEIKLRQDLPNRNVARDKTRMTATSSQTAKPVTVGSDEFTSKYAIVGKTGDTLERYVLLVSSPQSDRLVFKIDRVINYPNALARPKADDMLYMLGRRWGEPANGGLPKKLVAGETLRFVWYFAKDGSRYDRFGGCDGIRSIGQSVQAYSLDLSEQVKSANQSECNAFVSAEISVDSDMFVSAANFTAYSNAALNAALKRDSAALDAKLADIVAKTVTTGRRVVAPPKL